MFKVLLASGYMVMKEEESRVGARAEAKGSPRGGRGGGPADAGEEGPRQGEGRRKGRARKKEPGAKGGKGGADAARCRWRGGDNGGGGAVGGRERERWWPRRTRKGEAPRPAAAVRAVRAAAMVATRSLLRAVRAGVIRRREEEVKVVVEGRARGIWRRPMQRLWRRLRRSWRGQSWREGAKEQPWRRVVVVEEEEQRRRRRRRWWR